MRAEQPYRQSHSFDLWFRRAGTPSFAPVGPGGRQRVPNAALAAGTVDEFADRYVSGCRDDLADLRGELQVRVYADSGAEPVLVRTVELGGD